MHASLTSPSNPALEPWQEMLDAVATGILVVDGAGAVLHANPGAVRLLASDRSERSPLVRVLMAVGLGPMGAPGAAASGARQVEVAPGRVVECSLRPLHGTGHLVTLVDVSLQAQATGLAHFDPLTGLATPEELHRALAERLDLLGRGATGFGVLCVGLHGFGAVARALGHGVGGALLRQAGDRLREGVRSVDMVARMGDDEFAVVQGTAGPAEATAGMGRRLMDLLNRPYDVQGRVLAVDASLGSARAGTDGMTADDLLEKAGLALRRARAEGPGAVAAFGAGPGLKLA